MQYSDDILKRTTDTTDQKTIASVIQAPDSNTAMTNAQSLSSENKEDSAQAAFNPADNLLNTDVTIEIEINLLGKIKQIVLPEGATYERVYDDFGRVIYAKDANTGESIVEYDLNDQPILIQSKTSKQIADYDLLGRLTIAKYCKLSTENTAITEQSCETIEYKYNSAKLSQIIDPTQITQYTYDTQSLLIAESLQFKDSVREWQTKYQYDDIGRLQKVSLPEGATLSYVYNDVSIPVKVKYQAPVQGWFEGLIRKINPDHNSTAMISDIKGDSAHGLLGFTHSNGQTAKADYDKTGRLTAWQDGEYQKALTYNETNRIIATNSQRGDKENSQQLSYNNYGELTSVTNTKENQTTQYQYDLNGNRLSFKSSKAQTNYEYKVGTDQLLSASSKTNIASNNSKDTNSQKTNYSYDAAGNPTLISVQQGQDGKAQTRRQFTYGVRGQLTQIIDANQTTDYRYNHAMQRVSKTIANDEQRYLWQQGLLDAEIDVKGSKEAVTRRYIYVGLRPIAMIDYDTDNNASIYTIHTDHLGTPQQVSNNKQEIIWQGDYDAFGQVTVKAVSNNNTQDMQAKRKGWLPSLMNSANATQSITNEPFEFNLRFAGQYEDSESGYYYNWHRYYNPETGRYLTSDPIGLNGGLNTYGYAGQNPISAVDPWGLYTIFIGGAGDHEHFIGGEKFGLTGPTYNVKNMRNEFVSSFLAGHIKASGYTQDRAEYLAYRQARYYGYNEIHLALTYAKIFLDNNPNSTLNIVGHSLGGWQAAHLAQQINEYRCSSVANLITLDPVGDSVRIHAMANIEWSTPRPEAETWVNIRAEHLNDVSGNNIVANLGGQWDPTTDDQQPDYNYQLNTDHAFTRTMLTTNIIAHNFSPWDLLKRHYQGLPSSYDYENVPETLVHEPNEE
ncbi:RHS repeat-associated core domain-containing protein [Psychrobacter sp. HII-4]|uniref:RHS repeat-associated core domain-containing protein n=1 Tax=Psychrobacter sp. HII-4 TaxID=1569264 RepID=UPI00191B060C|nr:RHS repeat-associated core domain-containing protein [Psychrobacter sp. HII-4]